MKTLSLSFAEMWEKIIACDSRYDGLFFTAVKTTRIFCRPSCKARKPKPENVQFYYTVPDVEAAGYRPCKRCQPTRDQTPQMALITSAMAFLVDHYKQKLVLQDIAAHVGASPYYLERLFKRLTSETPRAYLEKYRVDKAAFLIATTGLTNLEICYEVGFQSPSNFYKVFRRIKHCSPSEYRKEHRVP
ncbi:AraC family transcriptional regulator of adaptative response / methylphosphotriester-DNA alkyltransferase methyltransferase [Tumebacillus sp. BK434]|uniref:bifunctional transcriptional activator/DNA repair enzyme AdaA n=1 Tax=Tumebacillus sp. BK434 TaxID=2512169 RepID=UPI00104AFC41|nr:Ada metal-binding domain-containing protein [Tumebacillus sp. BK434]TCP58104.1 AraC family transcriptional regulator of adaptative response / methylphosphotriester-DNA alkyltransferase methyltransferase [Tumebacillus sp. BK434]